LTLDRAEGGEASPATLRDLVLYFLRLGTLGFGGPIALAGHMQRELVVPEPVLILAAGPVGLVLKT